MTRVTHGGDLQKLMAAQTHWFKANTAALLALQKVNAEIQMQRAQNVHGLRVEFNIEAEVMDANSNGNWAVYVFPGDVITPAQTLGTWDDWDNENITQYLWGAGLWMASNQTPAHVVFAPQTSRNVPRGGRVLAVCYVEGTVPVLTANRVNIMMSYFAEQ